MEKHPIRFLVLSLALAPWLCAQERTVAFVDVTVVPWTRNRYCRIERWDRRRKDRPGRARDVGQSCSRDNENRRQRQISHARTH